MIWGRARQDMRLMWSNCHLYNKADSDIGLVGAKSSRYFEDLWAKSGLDQAGGLRQRRSTAGIAAAKYEPGAGPEERPRASSGPAHSSRAKKVCDLWPGCSLLTVQQPGQTMLLCICVL